ncbi:hypothetical protein P7C70_g6844, partial [Phenoliferia sp. Uapishka_3]
MSAAMTPKALPTELIANIMDHVETDQDCQPTLSLLCLVDRRFLALARPRLYIAASLAIFDEGGEAMDASSISLIRTLKSSPTLASLVRRIDIFAGRNQILLPPSLLAILASTIALTTLFTLSSNVDDLRLSLPVEPFDLVALTIINLRPTLRILELSASEQGEPFGSLEVANLLRGLPLLQELSADGVVILAPDALIPPTFHLTDLVLQSPQLPGSVPAGRETFKFLTAASASSLVNLKITGAHLLSPSDRADEELEPFKSLTNFAVSTGLVWQQGEESRPAGSLGWDVLTDGETGQAKYLQRQLAVAPESVRRVIISECDYMIRDGIIRKTRVLEAIPTWAHVVEIGLGKLRAKTLREFLEKAPALEWKVLWPGPGVNRKVDLDVIAKECEKRGIRIAAQPSDI